MKKVVVALPSVGRLSGLEIVAKLRRTLRANGYCPVFYLGMERKYVNREFQKAISKQRNIKLAFCTKQGYGNAIITAMNTGVKKEAPHAVVTLPDDYEVEAGHMHKLVEALRNRDVVVGSWDKTSWRTFPVPQFLNEIGTSLLVTYADPGFVPRNRKGLINFRDAVSKGRAIQTYTGMFAFTPNAWRRIEKDLKNFKPQHVAHSGVEVAIILSTLNQGLKLTHRRIPRRFEHAIPRGEAEARHRQSRAKQFQDAVEIIRHFLKRTGQTHKLSHVEAQAERVKQRIERRAILRSGQRVIERGKVASLMHLK